MVILSGRQCNSSHFQWQFWQTFSYNPNEECEKPIKHESTLTIYRKRQEINRNEMLYLLYINIVTIDDTADLSLLGLTVAASVEA